MLNLARTILIVMFPLLSAHHHSHAPVTGSKRSDMRADRPGMMDEASIMARIREKASALDQFLESRGFNTRYCFLADMRIPSGQNRFFIYDLRLGSVEASGLVAHGSGSEAGGDTLRFSNTPNSNCTSLGRYRIGNAYQGRFGLAYKLFGLDDSNSEAYNRSVVLHALNCVPDEPVFPSAICESWGCPSVSPAFLLKLKSYIGKSERPVLLWIYY